MRSVRRERKVISEGWTLWIERKKPSPEEWEELSRSLLIRLSRTSAECERLRTRVTELGERLEAAEAERDQANAIAEVVYEFFRKRVRETADRRRRPRRRTVR